VARPELARAVAGALETVADLVRRFDEVTVVSGRPTETLRALVPVPGVRLVGLYGLAGDDGSIGRVQAVRRQVEDVAARVPGAWVEDKGASLTVHYRAASDPMAAEASLVPPLTGVAERSGLTLLHAKRAVELAASTVPGKGAVIAQRCAEAGLRACLFAGDDEPDLDAFAALDRLATTGLATVKVAVRSEETPTSLLEAADVVVERPAGLVQWLQDLVGMPGPEAGR
jgi:trehalose 6-phosphate phosphatase